MSSSSVMACLHAGLARSLTKHRTARIPKWRRLSRAPTTPAAGRAWEGHPEHRSVRRQIAHCACLRSPTGHRPRCVASPHQRDGERRGHPPWLRTGSDPAQVGLSSILIRLPALASAGIERHRIARLLGAPDFHDMGYLAKRRATPPHLSRLPDCGLRIWPATRFSGCDPC
jgi:hypothetical protein